MYLLEATSYFRGGRRGETWEEVWGHCKTLGGGFMGVSSCDDSVSR